MLIARTPRLTRTRIGKNAVLREVSWDDFHKCLEERMKNPPALALKSDAEDRRTLEELAGLFWLTGSVLERGMDGHWNERRRNADLLLNLRQEMIDAANNLIQEETWIETRFQVCGTGRHTAK